MKPPFRLELLADHDRGGFSCGQEALDRYFKTQVTQDMRRRIANCFVAVESITEVIAGFYTIAAAGIPVTQLPEAIAKRMPRYPTLPAVRVGRLAVDRRFRGRGIGGALLADAAARAIEAEVAAFALLVDAKDEKAALFYQHHGFERFVSAPQTLFLPLATIGKTFLSQPRTRKKGPPSVR